MKILIANLKSAAFIGLFLLFTVHCSLSAASGQTLVGTVPIKWVATLPSTCVTTNKTRVLVYKYTATSGIYFCSAANTWTMLDQTASTTFTFAQGAIVASSPFINHTATWNNAGATFTNFKSNVTDTASGANSLLMDFQVGGGSMFNVKKDGTVTAYKFVANGSGSGSLTLTVPAAASGTITFPAGTTNFSATGGASQVVKQTSLGGAFTVGQLAASDLSDGVQGSGAIVLANTPTLITPNIGAATGTSLTTTGLIKSSGATAGIGYATGAGGAQAQATDKTTTVVSNTITTAITMQATALNAATIVSFTFTNSSIAATDTVLCTHQSGGTSGAYSCNAFPGAGSAVISVRNNTGGSLSEAIVLRITVIKSVSS